RHSFANLSTHAHACLLGAFERPSLPRHSHSPVPSERIGPGQILGRKNRLYLSEFPLSVLPPAVARAHFGRLEISLDLACLAYQACQFLPAQRTSSTCAF